MLKFLFGKPPQPREHAVREKKLKKTKDKHDRLQLQYNMRFAHTNNPARDRRLVRDDTLTNKMVYDGKGLAAVARSSREHR